MKKSEVKMVTIYDKKGNSREIKEDQKAAWVGKGYTLTSPKTETKQKEESK